MSLISLSSSSKDDLVQQAPFNFKNHFPQPIIIKPNSQVALINFYHYRDDGYYRINSQNNIIGFCLGDSRVVGYHYARVETGRYEGATLATAVADALNKALVQQNYSFQVAFAGGNPNANPITFDTFTISYVYVASPNSKGGSWSKLAGQLNNALQITNNDTDNNQSIVEAEAGQLTSQTAVMKRGELTHEGTYRAVGISKFGNLPGGQPIFAVNTLRGCVIGLVRKQFSELGNSNANADFNPDFADIKIDIITDPANALEHSITVSTLSQRQGALSILAPNGKRQTVKRLLPDAFVNANFQAEDLMGFEFVVLSNVRACIVRILKSTDNGATYTALPDDTGALNPDGKRNVYTQTVAGTQYTGVIYNSNGINDGQGGNVIGSASNLISPKYAPFIPFISMNSDGVSMTGIDLDNVPFTSMFADPQENFTMDLDEDDAGMLPAYDYAIGTLTPEAQGGAVVSADMDGMAMFKDNTDPTGLPSRVNQDKGVAPAVGNFVGTMIFSTTIVGGQVEGRLTFTGLNQNPFVCKIDTADLPVPTTTPWKMYLSGVFNHTLLNTNFTAGGVVKNNETSDHDEKIHLEEAVEQPPLGADLPASSVLLLGRIQQADLVQQAGQPNPRGNPARLTLDTPGGTIGKTIGFVDNVKILDQNTQQTAGDQQTTKIAQDNNIHISIPELSGVKSFEGEANNTAKTIKILPKNEFTSNDDTGSMTFTANYEDYIDINNAEELAINELSVQVRNPDGTMATNLQPTTRATIKIQQDPRVRENKRMELLERALSGRQDSGKDLVVSNNTGS